MAKTGVMLPLPCLKSLTPCLLAPWHCFIPLPTGPNTGGKTATMKALGLAACMAKTGMMLPAAAPARLPCFSSVLADIGDEQSLTASLSTFSGHIKRWGLGAGCGGVCVWGGGGGDFKGCLCGGAGGAGEA